MRKLLGALNTTRVTSLPLRVFVVARSWSLRGSGRHNGGPWAVDMEEVKVVLELLGLKKYAEAFEDEGYDDIAWMLSSEEDMLWTMCDEVNLAKDDASSTHARAQTPD